MNTTFPLGLTKEKAQFETRSVDENAQFLVEKIKNAYERKSAYEEPTAVKSLERYIILNAIDRLWQEHLYAMDALREGVYLRGYAQKDPLIEYKTEAYDIARRRDGGSCRRRRWSRGSINRSSDSALNTKSWPQRTVPLRQREKVQELLRPRGVNLARRRLLSLSFRAKSRNL